MKIKEAYWWNNPESDNPQEGLLTGLQGVCLAQTYLGSQTTKEKLKNRIKEAREVCQRRSKGSSKSKPVATM